MGLDSTARREREKLSGNGTTGNLPWAQSSSVIDVATRREKQVECSTISSGISGPRPYSWT